MEACVFKGCFAHVSRGTNAWGSDWIADPAYSNPHQRFPAARTARPAAARGIERIHVLDVEAHLQVFANALDGSRRSQAIISGHSTSKRQNSTK